MGGGEGGEEREAGEGECRNTCNAAYDSVLAFRVAMCSLSCSVSGCGNNLHHTIKGE